MKSEAILKKPKANYSYAIPSSASNQIYRSPVLAKDYSNYQKNEPNYLE